MAASKELTRLVENFDRNLGSYTSGAYNEAQVRAEFIDPMFELLGWDVQNKAGNAEAYKDVIHEDAIQIGGTTKAPDYCFRIGGTRKFFLEAKKPSVSIKDEPTPAYQLRRYAWSAKLPLSILSDFAELAVYDCRVKPEKTDKPAIARINYLTYDAYPSKWDEIATVFSKDAVLRGSFDRFAEEKKGKKGTAAVDAEFLKEIERWRDLLARNIALRNPCLSIRELNGAVQRTIDRIVFLRICEDRGIETQYPLQGLQNGTNVYPRLFELFQRADERYNSGLFHFQNEKGFTEAPDTLTPRLVVDDKVLKDIIGNLYYPDSPYEFSVLPADILGQVYEQFLGKVIRLTPTHRAVVEDKPEVKKAGGVYYTPTYIVDYIVEHTVGELLKEKTPKHAADLKILDPACGSGSFLLGAYQRLLDWHRDWYVNDGPDTYTKPRKGGHPALFQAGHGEWRLTTAERKRILLNSIFGVDIDPQAVEVTKLALLLKVLEGESDETISSQLKLFHERALPDLGSNIKCGNSLIGSDFFQGRQGSLFDNDEALRVNPFDWDKGFPEIFGRPNPGFDAVIGNPPYGAFFPAQEKDYLSVHLQTRVGKFDSYGFFMEKGLQALRQAGILGFITPHTWLTVLEALQLRLFLLNHASIQEIVQLPSRVFAVPTVETVLCFLRREESQAVRRTAVSKVLVFPLSASIHHVSEETAAVRSFAQSDWLDNEASAFNISSESKDQRVIAKVRRAGRPMKELADFAVGIQAYDSHTGQERSVIENRAFHSERREDSTFRKELNGNDVSRYGLKWPGKSWVSYGQWLAHPRQPRFFQGPRILVREIAATGPYAVHATLTRGNYVTYKTILNVVLNDEAKALGYREQYLLAILNSRLFTWLFRRTSNKLVTTTFPRISILDIKRFPTRTLELSNAKRRSAHDRLVELVDQMLALHAKLAAARTDHEKTVLQRQIDATDGEIDALVYALYGLTEDEIKIVEGVTR